MVPVPPKVRNLELWEKHCRKIRALAARLLSGETSVIEGSQQMLRLQALLHDKDNTDYHVFSQIVASATHLPIGVDPDLWQAEAFAAKRREIDELESIYRDTVFSSARVIRDKYAPSIPNNAQAPTPEAARPNSSR
jgi:hypothetical protein